MPKKKENSLSNAEIAQQLSGYIFSLHNVKIKPETILLILSVFPDFLAEALRHEYEVGISFLGTFALRGSLTKSGNLVAVRFTPSATLKEQVQFLSPDHFDRLIEEAEAIDFSGLRRRD